jgi:hypothetical protein
MKKTILTFALLAITAISFAQTKKDTTKSEYKADPKRVYTIEITAEQLSSMVETSRAGIIPYLKTIKLPMDKLDEAQAYFNGIHSRLADQYRKQYLTDSLKTLKLKLK